MAHATAHVFGSPPPGALGGKRPNIIKSQIQSQCQRFLNQTMCVFSQMKDIKDIRQELYSVPLVIPQGLGLGVVGVVHDVKKFNFLNMVIWHIKLMGTSSRQGYTETFYRMIKLVTL